MSFKFLSIYMDIDKNLEHCSLQAHTLCHYRYLMIILTFLRIIVELLLKKDTKNIFKSEIGNKRVKRLKR